MIPSYIGQKRRRPLCRGYLLVGTGCHLRLGTSTWIYIARYCKRYDLFVGCVQVMLVVRCGKENQSPIGSTYIYHPWLSRLFGGNILTWRFKNKCNHRMYTAIFGRMCMHFTFGGIAIRQPYASICQYPAFVANDSIKTIKCSCDWGTYPAKKKSMYITVHLRTFSWFLWEYTI